MHTGYLPIRVPMREIKMQTPVHTYELAELHLRDVIRNAFLVVLFLLRFLAEGFGAQNPGITFSKQVAPILFTNCVRCHRPGGIASNIPLLSYDEVRPRAKSIMQRVLAREMPPWPVDPNKSLKFRNDPSLSQHDIDTL